MRALMLALAALALGCETRGIADHLELTKTCYSVKPSDKLTIVAQASDGAGDGTNGLDVQWVIGPASVLKIGSKDEQTQKQAIEGVDVVGSAKLEVTIADGTMTPQRGNVIVFADAEGGLLSAQAEIVIQDDGGGCETESDAGVLDAGAPDAMIDAPIDAP